MKVLALTLILVFSSSTTLAKKCNSLKNVEIVAHSNNLQQQTFHVTGCIERTVFNDSIVAVHIENQTISRLGPDSIRNMKHLRTVLIKNSGIQVVDPTAFRNVPNLEIVKILNGDLQVIPEGVFNTERTPNLNKLYLTSNKISQVEDDAFVGLETLDTLYCDHNELQEWKKKWFTNSTNLAIMNFGYNKIKVIPRRAFESLLKLKIINFNFNELEVIESEAFEGLARLDYLGLKHNRLRSIHPRVFPNAMVISSLAMNANYLNFIPKKIMVTITVGKTSIDGNPWKCPCRDQILFWLHETNATIERVPKCKRDEIPVCSFSSTFKRACMETVEEDVTNTYLEQLRKIEPPLDYNCARLD